MPDDARARDVLTTLQTVLASAAGLAKDLTEDPLASRLLTALARMPPEDREAIVDVIEREVDLRLMSLEGQGPLSGLRVTKPNPNARLYLRVEDTEGPLRVSPEEIVRAVIRSSRVMHRSFQRGSKATMDVWGPAIVQGLRELGADERESLRWFHSTILEFVLEAGRSPH
jgi:hypothetical protein